MLLPGSGRIFSRSRIRTPLGKWDSPKSPQGYCRALADPDFQIRGGGGGGGGRSQMQFFCGPQFGLNITGAPPWIRHWLGKKTVFRKKMTEVRDTGWSRKRGGNAGWGHLQVPPPPRLLADPELPPLFHFLNFGKQKQYLTHSPTSTTTKTTNCI